jgi:hypothetical protein
LLGNRLQNHQLAVVDQVGLAVPAADDHKVDLADLVADPVLASAT